MAQRFWLLMISLQLVLASAVAVAVIRSLPGASAWIGIPIAACAFVIIQYLLIVLTVLVSRALSGESLLRDLVPATRVALSEAMYFGLAQLAMISVGRERAPTGEAASAGRNHRAPLVLVHGLACNRGIWNWLIPRLRAAGFASIYAVDLQPLHADIDVLARQLTIELRKILREHEGASVAIIGHSMGGLIARAALQAMTPKEVRCIVTVGTPHHGAAIARVLRWLPAKQMCPSSPWLAALNSAQEGCLPVALTSIWSADDNFVSPASSPRLRGAQLREISGVGHFGLLISPRAVDCVVRSLESAT